MSRDATVKRLRQTADSLQPGSEPEVALRVAADAIERLTRNERDALAYIDLFYPLPLPEAVKVIVDRLDKAESALAQMTKEERP